MTTAPHYCWRKIPKILLRRHIDPLIFGLGQPGQPAAHTMSSNLYPTHRHRLRSPRCIVVLFSLLLLPLDTSSFQLSVNNNRPFGIIGHVANQPSPFAAPAMPRPSRSGHSTASALSARTDSAQTQFVTNKRCPFAQKAWIALEASDCPYEMREVSLYGAGGKPDWFWEMNPRGTVPVVAAKDGGGEDLVLADSELILDAVGDGSIGSSVKRGDISGGVLALSNELNTEEKSLVDEWRDCISKKLIPIGKSAVLGGSLPKLRELLREMNDMVVGPYLAGERMTLADCAAFPFLWRINEEFGINDQKNLNDWLNNCVENESIKRTIPAQGWWWWW